MPSKGQFLSAINLPRTDSGSIILWLLTIPLCFVTNCLADRYRVKHSVGRHGPTLYDLFMANETLVNKTLLREGYGVPCLPYLLFY